MTTTGTATTTLDFLTIAEEAFERCGKELRTGYDLKSARRSLNLLTMEWANRGVNMWTVEQGTIPMVADTAIYDLPADTVDILEHVMRSGSGTSQKDVVISRVSMPTYAQTSSKNQTGRPTQLWVNRLSGATESGGVSYPTVTVWPVPTDTTYTLVYWRLRRMQDAGSGAETQDVPFRFTPALIAGLAYYLAIKIPDAISRLPVLKQMYDDSFQLDIDEDRERAVLRIVPRRA
jgi:hypothetical protein